MGGRLGEMLARHNDDNGRHQLNAASSDPALLGQS
jgi:hypothetical protein